jgi:hypothetical protein
MGSGWRSGGQHSKANYCHRAVIYPSRPSRHGSSCPTGASTPETTTAWLVGLGRSPVRCVHPLVFITRHEISRGAPGEPELAAFRPAPDLVK